MRFRFLITFAAFELTSTMAMARSSIVPIWAQIPDVAENIAAHDRFTRALRFRGIQAPKQVSIALPPPPRTPLLYRAAVGASPFDPPNQTLQAFNALVSEVLANGGAGLSRDELIDLFFRQAVAILRANAAPTPQLTNQDPVLEARRACLRAAVLGLDQMPTSHADNPLLREMTERAIFEVRSRPRATISINARRTATVFIDGQRYPFPVQAQGLAYGEHWVRVEERGFTPWSLIAIVSEPNFHIDPPQILPLQLPPAEAAQIARSQGATFSMLGQLRLGEQHVIDLSLVEAATGIIRASASVPAGGEETPLIAAVLRLDEEASRANLHSRQPTNKALPFNASLPPAIIPAPPSFQQDPAGWARTHWPLLTAIGTTVGSAILLGILVATENDSSARP